MTTLIAWQIVISLGTEHQAGLCGLEKCSKQGGRMAPSETRLSLPRAAVTTHAQVPPTVSSASMSSLLLVREAEPTCLAPGDITGITCCPAFCWVVDVPGAPVP